jgi:CHASE2 domain-containing sensor protein
MAEPDDSGATALRAFAVAAVALAGFLFSLTPAATYVDHALLDVEWRLLRKFDPRPAPDDIIVVGIDPATVNAIPEPPQLWHAALGRVLTRIAEAKPRAIGLDFPLPERSYDAIHAGLDKALFAGLASAAGNGPFVAVLTIDARTRSARRIHTPFLALLGDSRLGIGMLARDGDGVARQFSLLVPTDDGRFPTLVGRLCRALSKECVDGYVNYALGPAFRYVPMRNLFEMEKPLAEKLFRDRIVMVGETQPFSDRVPVPVNLAGWEPSAPDSPAIVIHAAALRTALLGGAPSDASRPLVVLLLSAAALLFLVRDVRIALASVALAAIAALLAALLALRGGVVMPAAGILFTLALAWGARAAGAPRARRRP